MSARQAYCVVETWTDGSEHVWGPFSEHRAAVAADALSDVDGGVGLAHVRVQPLLSSSRMDSEYPDWKRAVRV
jgi:hypothetical protein